MTARRVAGITALVALCALAACAETTVDPDPTGVTTAVTAGDGATLPTVAASPGTGSPASLGDQLVVEARRLSDHVVEGDGEVEALARLESTWTALRPHVEATRDDLLDDFDTAMALARRAVERRRPADADKASNNLATLVAAAALA